VIYDQRHVVFLLEGFARRKAIWMPKIFYLLFSMYYLFKIKSEFPSFPWGGKIFRPVFRVFDTLETEGYSWKLKGILKARAQGRRQDSRRTFRVKRSWPVYCMN
jgi:hypothetical protein